MKVCSIRQMTKNNIKAVVYESHGCILTTRIVGDSLLVTISHNKYDDSIEWELPKDKTSCKILEHLMNHITDDTTSYLEVLYALAMLKEEHGEG